MRVITRDTVKTDSNFEYNEILKKMMPITDVKQRKSVSVQSKQDIKKIVDFLLDKK